ncbi:hypothetical protein ACFLQP_03060 [Acidobacteriota bacterium]
MKIIKSFCRGVQGGAVFSKSAPLAAGGKVITRSNYTSGFAA